MRSALPEELYSCSDEHGGACKGCPNEETCLQDYDKKINDEALTTPKVGWAEYHRKRRKEQKNEQRR